MQHPHLYVRQAPLILDAERRLIGMAENIILPADTFTPDEKVENDTSLEAFQTKRTELVGRKDALLKRINKILETVENKAGWEAYRQQFLQNFDQWNTDFDNISKGHRVTFQNNLANVLNQYDYQIAGREVEMAPKPQVAAEPVAEGKLERKNNTTWEMRIPQGAAVTFKFDTYTAPDVLEPDMDGMKTSMYNVYRQSGDRNHIIIESTLPFSCSITDGPVSSSKSIGSEKTTAVTPKSADRSLASAVVETPVSTPGTQPTIDIKNTLAKPNFLPELTSTVRDQLGVSAISFDANLGIEQQYNLLLLLQEAKPLTLPQKNDLKEMMIIFTDSPQAEMKKSQITLRPQMTAPQMNRVIQDELRLIASKRQEMEDKKKLTDAAAKLGVSNLSSWLKADIYSFNTIVERLQSVLSQYTPDKQDAIKKLVIILHDDKAIPQGYPIAPDTRTILISQKMDATAIKEAVDNAMADINAASKSKEGEKQMMLEKQAAADASMDQASAALRDKIGAKEVRILACLRDYSSLAEKEALIALMPKLEDTFKNLPSLFNETEKKQLLNTIISVFPADTADETLAPSKQFGYIRVTINMDAAAMKDKITKDLKTLFPAQ